ncbi:MAG: flagellar motor switch protein FliN [Burkholderiales bacterium]|nr:flagellar motor switch protein FliN [Burkholderiales bacterium]
MAESEVKGDISADDWAAAMAEQTPVGGAADSGVDAAGAARAQVFPELHPDAGVNVAPERLELILDIPVQLTVELGRTKLAIRNLVQLAQGSIVELDRLAGEPLDVLVNGCLIAQGEVVVVNDKFGIRLTDVIAPEERVRRLQR